MYIEFELTIIRDEKVGDFYQRFSERVVLPQADLEAKMRDLMIRSPRDRFYISEIMILDRGKVYRESIIESEWLPLRAR